MWYLVCKCSKQIRVTYNRVEFFFRNILFFAGFFPDYFHTGRPRVGLGLELGLEIGFVTFCSKCLFTYWNHTPYSQKIAFSILYPWYMFMFMYTPCIGSSCRHGIVHRVLSFHIFSKSVFGWSGELVKCKSLRIISEANKMDVLFVENWFQVFGVTTSGELFYKAKVCPVCRTESRGKRIIGREANFPAAGGLIQSSAYVVYRMTGCSVT